MQENRNIGKWEANRGQSEPSLPAAVTHLQPSPLAKLLSVGL